MDETSHTPVRRLVIRVAAPPNASAAPPLPAIRELLENDGKVALGMRASCEEEHAPSEPSEIP